MANEHFEILKSVPFISRRTMTSTASTNGGAAWDIVRTLNCEWLELTMTCATKGVTVTITPDGGDTTTVVCAAGSTTTTRVMVYYASHVDIVLTSTVPGDHGTMTGKAVIHGMMKI